MEVGRPADPLSRDPVFASIFARSTSSAHFTVDLKHRSFIPTRYTLRAAAGTNWSSSVRCVLAELDLEPTNGPTSGSSSDHRQQQH